MIIRMEETELLLGNEIGETYFVFNQPNIIHIDLKVQINGFWLIGVQFEMQRKPWGIFAKVIEIGLL